MLVGVVNWSSQLIMSWYKGESLIMNSIICSASLLGAILSMVNYSCHYSSITGEYFMLYLTQTHSGLPVSILSLLLQMPHELFRYSAVVTSALSCLWSTAPPISDGIVRVLMHFGWEQCEFSMPDNSSSQKQHGYRESYYLSAIDGKWWGQHTLCLCEENHLWNILRDLRNVYELIS